MGKPKKTTKDEIKISEDDLKNNPKVILEYMKKDKTIFKNVSENVKKDVEFLLTVIQQYKSKFIFQYIPEELKKDKEFILKCLDFDKTAYLYCSEEVKKDFEVALKVVKEDKFFIQNIPEEFKKNKEFISKISQLYGINFSLQFSGEVLEEDKETLIKEIKEGKLKMSKLPENLKKDKEIISIILSKDGLELENLTEDFKKDPSLIEIAISQNSKAIEFISQDLLSSKDFVLKMLSKNSFQNGFDFYNIISKNLQNDTNIAFEFLKIDINIYQNLSNELKSNKILIKKMIEANLQLKLISPYMDKSLKSDRDIMISLISKDPSFFEFCSKELKKEKEILTKGLDFFGIVYILNNVDKTHVFNTIKGDLSYFKTVSEDLFQDPDKLVEFCEINGLEFVEKHLSDKIKEDQKIVLLLLEKMNIFSILPTKLKNSHEVIEKACKCYDIENINQIGQLALKDENFIKSMIQKGYLGLYQRINSILKNDDYFTNELMEINLNIFQSLSEAYRSREDFIVKALKSKTSLFMFISETLQTNVKFILKLMKEYNLDIYIYISDSVKSDSLFLKETFYKGLVKFDKLPEKIKTNKQNILEFLQLGLMENKDVDPDIRKDIYINAVMCLRETPSFKAIKSPLKGYSHNQIIKIANDYFLEILTSTNNHVLEKELIEAILKYSQAHNGLDIIMGLSNWAFNKSSKTNIKIFDLISPFKSLIQFNDVEPEELYYLKHGLYNEHIDDDLYLSALEYRLIYNDLTPIRNDLFQSVILKKNRFLIDQLTSLYKYDSWKFIWRKKSNFKDFYDVCCNSKMSITLIETKAGCIFGMYYPVAYDEYKYKYEYNTIKSISLFTLVNSYDHPPSKFKYVGQDGYKNSNGMMFGVGDLYISFAGGNNFSKFGERFTSDVVKSFDHNLLIFPDELYFEIKNMEVFEVCNIK